MGGALSIKHTAQCNVTTLSNFPHFCHCCSGIGWSLEILSSIPMCELCYIVYCRDMLLRLVFPSNFGNNHESPSLSFAIGGFIRFISPDTDTTRSAFILLFHLGPLLFLDLTLNVAEMIAISTRNNVCKFKFHRHCYPLPGLGLYFTDAFRCF